MRPRRSVPCHPTGDASARMDRRTWRARTAPAWPLQPSDVQLPYSLLAFRRLRCPLSLQREHRADRGAHDVVGRRAEEHEIERIPPVHAHDDEVNLLVACHTENL